MSNLTDRAAYLRGLADGMNLDASKGENKLMLEMLNLIDEMAQHIAEMDADIDELGEYVEDIDSDLGDVEELLFEDEEENDDDEDDEDDDSEEIVFECPNCGKPVIMMADAIDYEESPVCQYCGEPFFTDIDEDDDEDENGNG